MTKLYKVEALVTTFVALDDFEQSPTERLGYNCLVNEVVEVRKLSMDKIRITEVTEKKDIPWHWEVSIPWGAVAEHRTTFEILEDQKEEAWLAQQQEEEEEERREEEDREEREEEEEEEEYYV